MCQSDGYCNNDASYTCNCKAVDLLSKDFNVGKNQAEVGALQPFVGFLSGWTKGGTFTHWQG